MVQQKATMSLDGTFTSFESTMKYKRLFAFFVHSVTCSFHSLRWLLIVFTIARALMMKAQVICARSKENISVFDFYDANLSTKSKLTVNFLAFPSVKFFKFWRSCNHIHFL